MVLDLDYPLIDKLRFVDLSSFSSASPTISRASLVTAISSDPEMCSGVGHMLLAINLLDGNPSFSKERLSHSYTLQGMPLALLDDIQLIDRFAFGPRISHSAPRIDV